MSICSHCGQEHDASLRICPKTGKAIGPAAASVQKTLFGVPSALFPPAPEPRKGIPSSAEAPPAPRPQPPSHRPDALALGKTMFSVAPTSPKLPPPATPPIRLPTEAEARENPNLVITLDLTPPAGTQTQATARARAAEKAPDSVGTEAPVDLPGVEWSSQAGPDDISAPPEGTPTDLPPPGKGKPFALPQPKDGAAAGERGRGRSASYADHLTADTKSVFALFQWALTTYLRKPAPLFLLAAMLVLPASVLQSCLLAGVARGPEAATLAKRVATVDFSARKAVLAARIQASQARGEIDKQAAAELAALTAAETVPLPEEKSGEGGGWLREKLVLLIQGLLLFGLAFPIACGTLAIATADLQGGAALPGFGDLWPILLARGELFLISLVPAALLVAVGNALFVLPGLVLSVLLVFVPHVVLFEKRGGRPALARSIELVRSDAIRVALAFLSFALLGFAAATLTGIFLPASGSRAVVFLHFLVGDLLSVAILPVPALMLARIYLDLRSRTGASPERLSRAART